MSLLLLQLFEYRGRCSESSASVLVPNVPFTESSLVPHVIADSVSTLPLRPSSMPPALHLTRKTFKQSSNSYFTRSKKPKTNKLYSVRNWFIEESNMTCARAYQFPAGRTSCEDIVCVCALASVWGLAIYSYISSELTCFYNLPTTV